MLIKEFANGVDDILLYIKDGKEYLKYKTEIGDDAYAIARSYSDYISKNQFADVKYLRGDIISVSRITYEGRAFIARGGLARIYEMQEEERLKIKELYESERKISILTEKNLSLSNNELAYNKKLRFWKVLSLLLAILASLASLIFLFK